MLQLASLQVPNSFYHSWCLHGLQECSLQPLSHLSLTAVAWAKVLYLYGWTHLAFGHWATLSEITCLAPSRARIRPKTASEPGRLFHAVVQLLDIHTTGQGLETALAPVPSPQAGYWDLESCPLDTQTCLPWRLMGKSGQHTCTRA